MAENKEENKEEPKEELKEEVKEEVKEEPKEEPKEEVKEETEEKDDGVMSILQELKTHMNTMQQSLDQLSINQAQTPEPIKEPEKVEVEPLSDEELKEMDNFLQGS